MFIFDYLAVWKKKGLTMICQMGKKLKNDIM